MLARKCEETVGKLLKQGDFNVRITVVKRLPRNAKRSRIDDVWIKTLKESVGGGILFNSTNMYLVTCVTEHSSINFETTGNRIVDECWKYIQNINVFRINIIKNPYNRNNTHSWIIVRE